ncbi:MAG: EamA family transporter, partial [Rikenellaceae bacterium]
FMLSAFALNEKITPLKYVGVVLGLSGALLAILSDGAGVSFGGSHLKGNLLVFSACFCYSLYTVWVKPLLQKYEPITVMAYVFLFGAIVMLPFLWRDL